MSPGLQTFPQCCTCAFQLRMPLKAITHPSSGSGICWQWSVHLCLHAGQLGLQITCFNFQTVQITWDAGETSGSNLTFMYRFQDDPAYVQCLHYSIHGSHTNGCLLSTAGDDILHFVLLNGSHALINRSQWLSDHLKPGSPRDVSFQWEEEAVTVSCVQLPYSGILYEVQHRSTFDTEWQSQDAETCNVTIHGLDPDKCYRFRVRARTKLSVYGPEAQPSEWSAISHWKRARPKDSCSDRAQGPKLTFIFVLASILSMGLLFLSLWKLHSVKKFLVPTVPDPRSSFPGLFECHRGDFQQEWISDTQNVAPPDPMEDSAPEHTLVIHLPRMDPQEVPGASNPGYPEVREQKATVDSPRLPRSPPESTSLEALAQPKFTLADTHYVVM
ncbi:cytokine receptor-like factor 2 isoform X1 [Oryctolagus cuniculus]|uniref:cytokine receptor-like factor 2 isoform X1 n=1 Tax=Oryctolagus cuniculus TaxID=9986 RepID=UPI0038799E3D